MVRIPGKRIPLTKKSDWNYPRLSRAEEEMRQAKVVSLEKEKDDGPFLHDQRC